MSNVAPFVAHYCYCITFSYFYQHFLSSFSYSETSKSTETSYLLGTTYAGLIALKKACQREFSTMQNDVPLAYIARASNAFSFSCSLVDILSAKCTSVERASICFGFFKIGFAELVKKSNSQFSISLASSLSFSVVLVIENCNLARYLSLID